MNKTGVAVQILCCLALAGPAQAASVVSHFPERGVGQFLAEQFDLASIRSSFGPRRTLERRTFASHGLAPTRVNDRLVEFAPGDWLYRMVVTERRDINGDGVEDLAVCFTDRAMNGGSYDTRHSLLITRFSPDAYAVALSYTTNACDATADEPPPEDGPRTARQVPETPYYSILGKFIYAYHREGVSLKAFQDPELGRSGPPELAGRAQRLAQQFDWILNGEIMPLEAGLNEILREAVSVSAAIKQWRQGSAP